MANDLNLCQFIGRLGADPETRYTQSGDGVCNFRIAVGEAWKDKEGNKQERTEWVSVVAWGKLGEICQTYLTKGSRIYVSGKWRTRKWQGQDGQDRYTTELIASNMQMLDSRGDGQAAPQQQSQGQQQATQAPVAGELDDWDDSIPF